MDFYQSFETNKLLIIESFAGFLGYIILKFVIGKITEQTARRFDYQRSRVKVVKKIINFILFVLLLGFLLTIWGVDQGKLVYFLTTLLTVLGIAFFAQWSIISNITSSLIIFFNHPVRIGDTIRVLDKEFQIEGKIADISIFFLIIKTAEGAQITMPSNLFMQKMIMKIEQEEV